MTYGTLRANEREIAARVIASCEYTRRGYEASVGCGKDERVMQAGGKKPTTPPPVSTPRLLT